MLHVHGIEKLCTVQLMHAYTGKREYTRTGSLLFGLHCWWFGGLHFPRSNCPTSHSASGGRAGSHFASGGRASGLSASGGRATVHSASGGRATDYSSGSQRTPSPCLGSTLPLGGEFVWFDMLLWPCSSLVVCRLGLTDGSCPPLSPLHCFHCCRGESALPMLAATPTHVLYVCACVVVNNINCPVHYW